MSKRRNMTKKEKTLIESVIDDSKEIVKLKNVIQLLSMTIFQAAQCNNKIVDYTPIKGTLQDYRRYINELEIHSANKLKAFYSGKYIIIPDKFHFTTAEMQAGCIEVVKNKDGKKIRCILFLSDIEDPFVEPIEAGEIKELTQDLIDVYLPLCKPVWTKSSFNDLLLEHLKTLIR